MLDKANVTRRISEMRKQCLRCSNDERMHPHKRLLSVLLAYFFDETATEQSKLFIMKVILGNFGYGKHDRKYVVKPEDGEVDLGDTDGDGSDNILSSSILEVARQAEESHQQSIGGKADGTGSTGKS